MSNRINKIQTKSPLYEDGIKPSKAELRKWEKILRQYKLSMNAGDGERISKTDRRRRLVYGHKGFDDTDDGRHLEFQTYGCGGGRRVLSKPNLD